MGGLDRSFGALHALERLRSLAPPAASPAFQKLFMRGYRAAQNAGEAAPKAVLKLGHWHAFRGVGPSGLQTLGNFATELATSNGRGSLAIAVFIHGSADNWREIGAQDGMKPIAMAASPTEWTVLDFRPVREAVAAGELGAVSANLRRYLYGFDAAVVMAGASPASEGVVKSSGSR